MIRSMKALVLGLGLGLVSVAQAKIEFIEGPATVDIGDMATIKVPAGWSFVPKDGMKEFAELTENLYSETELGVLLAPKGSQGGFWAFFEFEDTGYIKDAASEKLDAEAMWESMKGNDEEANKVRQEKGYPTSTMGSWKIPPHYNPENQRLEWAYSFMTSGNKEETVNYNTRILGRRGVMRVIVVPTGTLDESMPVFNQTIAGFDYKEGNRYAEFTDGDKIAKYGLAALVVGGAAAAAASSGLLGKFFKFILVAIVGLFALIKKFFNKITGRGGDEDSGAPRPLAEQKPQSPDSSSSKEG